MPYNPGVQPQGGALLAQGIGSGMSKLASYFMGLQEKGIADKEALAQKASETKQLRSLAKTQFPEMKDYWDTAGYEELKGKYNGLIAKGTMEDQAMKRREQIAKTGLAEQGLQQNKAGQNAMAQYFGQQAQGGQQMVPAGPRGGMSTVARPNTPPESLRNFMQSLASNPGAAMTPEIQAMLKQVQEANLPGKKSLFGVDKIGVPQPMEGLPDKMFVPTTNNSGQIVDKETKKPVGSLDPRIYSENMEDVMAAIQSVPDPEVHRWMLDQRTRWMRASGKSDPMAELLAQIINGGNVGNKKPAAGNNNDPLSLF
jgi:hypothetical protein